MDAALSLVALPGKRHVVSEWRIETRNDYLRALAQRMQGRPWTNAGLIAHWCRQFMAGPFQIMQRRELLFADLVGMDIPRCRICFLREASRPRVPLPLSQGRVYELIK